MLGFRVWGSRVDWFGASFLDLVLKVYNVNMGMKEGMTGNPPRHGTRIRTRA